MTTTHTIIPHPMEITANDGVFTINADTKIHTSQVAHPIGEYLAASLRTATGFELPVTFADYEEENSIFVSTGTHDGTILGDEGYTLESGTDCVVIRANELHGLFNGVQTLRQMLPVEIESDSKVENVAWEIPAYSIVDKPRFQWRGLHLDTARRFFPVEFIKKFIDLMALQKFNVFHWHITEDQGWRIEIKQYPKLTEIGSKRSATPLNHDRTKLDGVPYEGYYTQDEIREVVAYAQERFITVVPEIEMPGHALAALTAYPQYGCRGEGYKVRTFWGIEDDVFCAGNEGTFTFLENILQEVFELFPSKYIHIGGDECPKVRWEECPKCQARIQAEGLADEHELQSYFIRRMETFLNDNGRQLVGWDEILEGGLAPNATVMSWRGAAGGIEAATKGHDVVMSPNTHCYLDYYQSADRSGEPPAIGNLITLEQAYTFNPVEGIAEDKHKHVIGGQGNLWTEYMPDADQVEYMAYPRASALAETMWSPIETLNYDDFLQRLEALLNRFDHYEVNYRAL